MYKNYLVDYVIRQKENHPLSSCKLNTIIVNTTNNNLIQSQKNIYFIVKSLNILLGQLPKLKKAQRNVSAFNIRANSVIGTKTNLKKSFWFKFLTKLIFTIIPNYKHWQNLKVQNSVKNKLIFNIGFKDISFWYEWKDFSQTGLHVQLIIEQASKKKDFLFFLSKFNINLK